MEKFRIPKVKSKENIKEISVNDTHFKSEILPKIFDGFRRRNESEDSMEFIKAWILNNAIAEKTYIQRRQSMRKENPNLVESIGFLYLKNAVLLKNTISKKGVEIGNLIESYLGTPSMGVSICQFSDIYHPGTRNADMPYQGILLIVKFLKGKIRFVTDDPKPMDPQPNYDCHLIKNPIVDSLTTVFYAFHLTQVFVYEYNEDGNAVRFPSQILPVAAVEFRWNGQYIFRFVEVSRRPNDSRNSRRRHRQINTVQADRLLQSKPQSKPVPYKPKYDFTNLNLDPTDEYQIFKMFECEYRKHESTSFRQEPLINLEMLKTEVRQQAMVIENGNCKPTSSANKDISSCQVLSQTAVPIQSKLNNENPKRKSKRRREKRHLKVQLLNFFKSSDNNKRSDGSDMECSPESSISNDHFELLSEPSPSISNFQPPPPHPSPPSHSSPPLFSSLSSPAIFPHSLLPTPLPPHSFPPTSLPPPLLPTPLLPTPLLSTPLLPTPLLPPTSLPPPLLHLPPLFPLPPIISSSLPYHSNHSPSILSPSLPSGSLSPSPHTSSITPSFSFPFSPDRYVNITDEERYSRCSSADNGVFKPLIFKTRCRTLLIPDMCILPIGGSQPPLDSLDRMWILDPRKFRPVSGDPGFTVYDP